ncbi:MAG: MarR family winged helix-turn-helix transcriptional regulator [Acidobacteriota bacterium]
MPSAPIPTSILLPEFTEMASMPTHCASYNLRRADRVVTQLYDEALRESGLKSTQFTLLSAVRIAGPVAINCLAERLVMDRTTLTRNLRLLQKEGWVEIHPGSRDRRVREVSLTEEGGRVQEGAFPLWQKAQSEVAERLGTERLYDLLAGLNATVEAIRD